MTRNGLLIGIMCCLTTGVLFPQRASSMLPVANDAHRRFYREQEWIWSEPEHPASSVDENTRRDKDSTMATRSPQSSLAFTVPVKPPQSNLAFTVPVKPPQSSLAFTVPVKLPQSNLAFTVPVKPPQSNLAFTVPVKPPQVGLSCFSLRAGLAAWESA